MKDSSPPKFKVPQDGFYNSAKARPASDSESKSTVPKAIKSNKCKKLDLSKLAIYKQQNVHFKFDRLPLKLHKPSKKPVVLSELLDEIAIALKRFVIMSDDQADLTALWVTHTYLVDVFDTSPILIIDAPERACAKTLLQQVISSISFRPLLSSNATPSVLFRAVDAWHPTIFFDEADTFFKDKNDMIGMVNAGYKKGGFVLRSEAVNDTFEPRQFDVYSAKSIAGIALDRHLPDATLSRGIIIKMRRKLPDEKVERLRYAEDDLFDNLCAKLMRFAIDSAEQVYQARPHLPDDLSDRAQDNWEPLLAIALCAGDEWSKRATDAALRLSSIKNESVSTGNELLSDIQSIFESQKANEQYADKISTADLIKALVAISDGPWASYYHGNPITPRQLSKQLANYDIHSKTVRVGPYDTPKGYALDQFTDAFKRYLTPKTVEVPTDLPPPIPPIDTGDESDLY